MWADVSALIVSHSVTAYLLVTCHHSFTTPWKWMPWPNTSVIAAHGLQSRDVETIGIWTMIAILHFKSVNHEVLAHYDRKYHSKIDVRNERATKVVAFWFIFQGDSSGGMTVIWYRLTLIAIDSLPIAPLLIKPSVMIWATKELQRLLFRGAVGHWPHFSNNQWLSTCITVEVPSNWG